MISKLSNRMFQTDMPMINKVGDTILRVKQMNDSNKEFQVSNLVQGMVYWGPPERCIQKMREQIASPELHKYCEHDFGTRALIDAIQQKIESENGLKDHQVIVTAGANQGFASVVCACCDPGDHCVIFSPYYFNHLMAIQMSNAKPFIIETSVHNNYLPTMEDFDKLQQQIDSGSLQLKMIVVCNPCNPTGAVYTPELLECISNFCKRNQIWMVCDETYEYFIFNELNEKFRHYTPVGSHIIHLYSFSKAYGLMGWRVGYIAYHNANAPQLTSHLHKYQDTVPICCAVPSQFMALEALKIGKEYALTQIDTLRKNREYLWKALSPYRNSALTHGAMYFFAQFPNFVGRESNSISLEEEFKVIEWMIRKHQVAVLPGSAFGMTGYFRVSYANVNNEQCKRAAKCIENALRELATYPDLNLDE
jgi:aspartate/methionine/tyrosine aminotransferase